MRLATSRHLPALRALLAGWIAFGITAIFARGQVTPYNNYVILARAFLHGRVAIDLPGAWIDGLPYNGAHYIIEGPFCAVLLMPWVAIFGTANQTLLSLVLCAVAVGCCRLTCENLGVVRASARWICAFFLLGTSLCWCAMYGDVWFVAHVASAACTFAALAESTGKRRGWLVALLALGALFSRFTLLLAIPVYAWLLLRDRTPAQRRTCAIGFGAVLAVGALLWLGYNEARWGLWYDIGYTAFYHWDPIGGKVGSPFQMRYLQGEIHAFFFQRADFQPTWPFFVPGRGGLALTYASPALLVAFAARKPRGLVIAMWLATVAIAAPSFVYYASGFAQFGIRHALDFEPFTIVLMALALRERMTWVARVLIAWSALVGLWGIWYWITFYR